MTKEDTWSCGYVTDLQYTFGYYAELNPLRVKLAFLSVGLVSPEMGTACELGYGHGLSVSFHAAATVTTWTGTDFNPTHAKFASDLVNVSGCDSNLYDQPISEFVLRSDLPDFDYICLHGVWSWISDENRAHVVDFVRRKLKPGGVLYVSYNTQPGFAGMVPIRDLLIDYGDAVTGKEEGTGERVSTALQFVERLMLASPDFCASNPRIVQRVNSLKGLSRNYLAHEYFNRDWLPMSFGAMSKWLAPASLDFACSANSLDVVRRLRLNGQQVSLLKGLADESVRQTAYDFMVNQSFRKDYWVKGARRLNSLEQVDSLLSVRVVLTVPGGQVFERLATLQAEHFLNESAFRPVVSLLSDYRPRSLGELANIAGASGMEFAELVNFTLILTGVGMMAPVQDSHLIAKSKIHTDRLNAHIMSKARISADIGYLVSPVTGGGFQINQFQQLLLLAISQGACGPDECCRYAVNALLDGALPTNAKKHVVSPVDEKLKQLTAHAYTFLSIHLPILRGLQIV